MSERQRSNVYGSTARVRRSTFNGETGELIGNRHGARVGKRETGLKSVYLAVHRKAGERDKGFDRLASGQWRLLVELGASYLDTEDAPAFCGYLWVDWYRIPVRGESTVVDIARRLHARGLTDGPYWGLGHVGIIGMGAGESNPQRRKATAERNKLARQTEQRERYPERFRKLLRRLGLSELWHTLGTDGFADATECLDKATGCLMPFDAREQANGEATRWVELTLAQWCNLWGRYPMLVSLYRHCERLLEDSPADWRLEALVRWMVEQVYTVPEEQPEQEALVPLPADAKGPIRDTRNEESRIWDEQQALFASLKS